MSQTLIAIGALAITITFALSTQRAEIKTDRLKILAESQILAGQVAQNTLAHIAVQEFDERTRNTEVERADQLTPSDGLEWGGCTDYALCDDVDDFHNMTTVVATPAGGMSYTIDAAVRYVEVGTDGSGEETVRASSSQTFYKEVTVTVRDVPRAVEGVATHIMPVPIRLQRIVPMT